MQKKYTLLTFLITLFSLATVVTAFAQGEGELTLRLARDFGYSSGTGKIQGTFSMKAQGPDNLQRVAFVIDGEIVAEDDTPPFKYQFNTSSYPLGIHELQAIGTTSDGLEIASNVQKREFVSSDEAWKTVGKIAGPIIVIALGGALLSFIGPMVLGRGKKSTTPLGLQRRYGIFGGTICPKCGRPFSLHFYGFNLVGAKLDRCPHCGKWSLVRRTPLSALREAEAAEIQESAGSDAGLMSDEERLKRQLDDSRYEDI